MFIVREAARPGCPYRSADTPIARGLVASRLDEEIPMASRRLTIQQRKEIFHTLVVTQDEGMMTVPQSFDHVSKQFEVTESMVRQIADEGIEKEWPPLDAVSHSVG
jgi:hypothetical protein